MTGRELAIMLARGGQNRLAEAVGLSNAEISRKLADQPDHGWAFDQLAKAFEHAGIRPVGPDTDDGNNISIPRDELAALNLLASRYLTRRVNGDGGK